MNTWTPPQAPWVAEGGGIDLFSCIFLRNKYLPGVDNLLPDALPRWEYPASQALADLTKHGSVQDEMDIWGPS